MGDQPGTGRYERSRAGDAEGGRAAMGERPVVTRPVERGSTYAPPPEERDRLAFADGPPPPERSRSRRPGAPHGTGPSRRALVAAGVAVAVAVMGVAFAFAVANRPDTATREAVDRPLDRGPFDTADEFILALHLPATFTRLAPEDASSFADADFAVADGNFEAACAGLSQALRDMDPTFPELVAEEYVGGGVNRCEATGPMASLHGATVRALVLKANTGVQLYIDDATMPVPPRSEPAASPTSPVASVPPSSDP
jgi:hypothetical protein